MHEPAPRLLQRLKSCNHNVEEVTPHSRLEQANKPTNDNVEEVLPHSPVEKANEGRQRKRAARERIKAEDPDLYELITLVRNHSRLGLTNQPFRQENAKVYPGEV
jgi:hypothetical protein